MANETENKPKAVIAAEVDPKMKEQFKKCWQKRNFASEAEAIRHHVRQIIEEDSVG